MTASVYASLTTSEKRTGLSEHRQEEHVGLPGLGCSKLWLNFNTGLVVFDNRWLPNQ